MTVIDNFLVNALIAGVGVALVAGPLGSFIVWRRLAYFGDALAHSALLGVALGFLFAIEVNVSVIAVCLLLAALFVMLERRGRLAGDTILGILAHAGLSLGLVALAVFGNPGIDLIGLLFGDILAVDGADLAWIYGGGGAVMVAVIALWRPLLATTVNDELARAEGVPVTAIRFAFMLLVGVVIAIAMKIVGVLLITSLLIIPAAAARRLARTPEQMAVFASLLGSIAVAGGLWGSLAWDTPSGPSIVLAALVIFLLAGFWPRRRLSASTGAGG